jgi:tetratricopeptide (TPR) repeat protein
MESYEKEWLAGHPVLLAIMRLVGLFDRPVSRKCLFALRRPPLIKGLTDEIVNLDDTRWQRAITRLREVRLLAPPDLSEPGSLDAHPLIREWFGERLKRTNEAGWKAAHSRLYDHLRDTTKEGKTPTLEDLAPLYQAIGHGCRAGRYKEALEEIYFDRICRRQKYYSARQLGAFSSDLVAISWFFRRAYEEPVDTLTADDQFWVISEAARSLRAQGRLSEALLPLRIGLENNANRKEWTYSAAMASNLAESELLIGEMSAAVITARQSVNFSKFSEEEFYTILSRSTFGEVLHAMGEWDQADALFVEAEQLQQKRGPTYPMLSSIPGYRYCDLLLAKGDYTSARDRAAHTLELGKLQYDILSRALDTLMLGRAHLGIILSSVGSLRSLKTANADLGASRDRIEEAVEGLRASGQNDDLPRGMLARAKLRRTIGDWGRSARDLDEVEEIAEPGPMRLYLCDLALERARLSFARIEAFAPLNGMLEKDNPPKPAVPSAEQIAELKGDAEKQIQIASDYIEKCSYHRHDEERAELRAVLRGEKKFADLPPRV